MNVTVEHIVIAVVALALIYYVIQHRNLLTDLSRIPDRGHPELKAVKDKHDVLDKTINFVTGWMAPDRGLTKDTRQNMNQAHQYSSGNKTCRNMNRIQEKYSDETKTTFNFNGQSKTVPYRSTFIMDEDCSNIFIDPNANNMTPELAKAACESICVRPSTSTASQCTLESETPGTYGAGSGYFNEDGSWVNRYSIDVPVDDPHPTNIQAYRCKKADRICYDCPI